MPTNLSLKIAQKKYSETTRRDKFTTLQIPKHLHAQIKELAAVKGITMIELITIMFDNIA